MSTSKGWDWNNDPVLSNLKSRVKRPARNQDSQPDQKTQNITAIRNGAELVHTGRCSGRIHDIFDSALQRGWPHPKHTDRRQSHCPLGATSMGHAGDGRVQVHHDRRCCHHRGSRRQSASDAGSSTLNCGHAGRWRRRRLQLLFAASKHVAAPENV